MLFLCQSYQGCTSHGDSPSVLPLAGKLWRTLGNELFSSLMSTSLRKT